MNSENLVASLIILLFLAQISIGFSNHSHKQSFELVAQETVELREKVEELSAGVCGGIGQ